MCRGLRQTKMSSIIVETVQSPCQAVMECWVDCSRLVVQRHRNFCQPIEYWTSERCRRWRWPNEDDSNQCRWRWVGTGTGLGVVLAASEVASRPVKCRRVTELVDVGGATRYAGYVEAYPYVKDDMLSIPNFQVFYKVHCHIYRCFFLTMQWSTSLISRTRERVHCFGVAKS